MSAGMIRRQLQGGAVEGTAFRRRGRALACLLGLTLALSGSVSAASAEVPANGRAWELVTAPDPVSATVFGLDTVAPGGDRLLYQSLGPPPGAPSGSILGQNIAVRGADGWRTEAIGAPHLVPKFSGNSLFGVELAGVDEGLSTFFLRSFAPLIPGGPEDPHSGIYRQRAGSLTLLADLETMERTRLVSADATHFVFATSNHLLAGDAGRVAGSSIYEATAAGLSQVDVDSGGSLLSTCGSDLPERGISSSGERIFFVHPSEESCGPARLYLRESGATTIEVSASRCTRPDCNEAQDVRFAGSTRDGAVAFLTTQQQLTDDDQNSKRDLYRFDTVTDDLRLVSPGTATMEGEVMDFSVLASADGSKVYFHGTGRLLPGQGTEGEEGLYLADGGDLRFLGSVSAFAGLQISADGRIAMVSTPSPLEPGDSDGRADVYRYDAVVGSWLRISAGPGGGNGPFDALVELPDISAPDRSPAFRALTRDGAAAFFNTPESLVPEDHNTVGDVYEWSSGQLGLVSSGEGSDSADFAGVSPDGVTAVLQTSASLLPGDRDGGDRDLYAARIGGGFDEPVTAPEACGPCVGPPAALVRPEAASARVRADRKGRLRVRLADGAAARELARTGRMTIAVSVPAPGRVSAEAHSRLAGKSRVAARGVAGAVRPGRLRLQLTATPPARRALLRNRSLRLRLELNQPPLRLVRTITLKLGGGK